MRKKNGIIIASASLAVLAGASAWADDAAPAKPAVPGIADILMSSGITATGYVDATFSAFKYSGSGFSSVPSSDTFNFQQAGLTLAYQPSSGFGALINPVFTPYSSLYVDNQAPDSNYYLHTSGSGPGAPSLQLFQGYAQYATGALTVIAGKFATLAGAEVYAPPGNTNVTRSLLFTFEPLTHTGVRATYVANSKATINVGLNNGWWYYGDETAPSPGKTLEVGVTLNPTKSLAVTLDDYYGRDVTNYGTLSELEFFDSVVTYTVTSQLSLVGSFDYGNVAAKDGLPSANWYGFAGYVNYQFNPKWRVSLRGEYVDDHDGYLTATSLAGQEDLSEVTATFGWDPVSHLEFRIEGRYDSPSSVKPGQTGTPVNLYPDTTQGWLEALYKF
jgi:hypothetical protein